MKEYMRPADILSETTVLFTVEELEARIDLYENFRKTNEERLTYLERRVVSEIIIEASIDIGRAFGTGNE